MVLHALNEGPASDGSAEEARVVASFLTRGEALADRLLSDANRLTDQLRRTARLPRSNRAALRLMGSLLCTRNTLANRWSHLDPSGKNAAKKAAIDSKLAAAESTLGTVLDLWSSRHSHLLDWIIIALIALDIVAALAH